MSGLSEADQTLVTTVNLSSSASQHLLRPPHGDKMGHWKVNIEWPRELVIGLLNHNQESETLSLSIV